MKIGTVGYLLCLSFASVILEQVFGEIKNGTECVCSICSCSEKLINCRNRHLNNSFSEEAWQRNYSQFTEAIFDNNQIGHLVRLPALPLKKLSYRNNHVVKIDPSAFINLPGLEELYLNENQLTSDNLLPAVFKGNGYRYRLWPSELSFATGHFDSTFYEPLNLKLLDLSGNELHTLHQDVFEHLPFLERLYLRENPFNILDRQTVIAISSLPSLQILDLARTKIKQLPMGFLHTLNKLQELVLIGNFFTEIPNDVLAESHNLRILNLNENPIRVLSMERPFPQMPSLKQLHISYMPNLTRIEEGSLSGLINLEYLSCRMNEWLAYISPKAFTGGNSNWPNMVKLDLSDNHLRYLDRELLKPVWHKIKHINIMGNPLVCDCENQWIVSELVPLLLNITSPVYGLYCAEPSAMKGHRLVTLYSVNYTMRCLDLYGNHPESDGPILISIFVMIILTLVVIIGAVIWVKSNNTCRQGGRVNYHRAFYKPTRLEEADKY